VTLDPPSALSPRVLNALKADPRTVDLRALAPHFYDLGARILELFEEEEMIEVLSDVPTTRRRHGHQLTCIRLLKQERP
jgi:GINS complex subunit 3